MALTSSFKSRIITIVILLLTLSLVISNSLSYKQLYSLAKSNIDDYSELHINSTSDKINAWFQTIKDGLIATAPDFSVMREDDQLNLMVKQINASIKSSEILVGFEDGRSYSAIDGTLDLSEYDPRSRNWYQEARRQGKTVIMPIYRDAFTNNLLVSIAEPFYHDGKLQGVLLADI